MSLSTERPLPRTPLSPSLSPIHSYFVQVNRWLHFLIHSTSPGGGYLVDNIDLMGFETVWEVCLRAKHPAVVDKATKFFIELHLQVRGSQGVSQAGCSLPPFLHSYAAASHDHLTNTPS